MASGMGRLDSVLPAQPTKGAGGDPQGPTGVLVAGVKTSGAFDALAGDLFHSFLLSKPAVNKKKAANSVDLSLQPKKNRGEISRGLESNF